MGYFCQKNCPKNVSKVAQSGRTDWNEKANLSSTVQLSECADTELLLEWLVHIKQVDATGLVRGVVFEILR